jgi:membrane peptidoglycan carboxypeptidase
VKRVAFWTGVWGSVPNQPGPGTQSTQDRSRDSVSRPTGWRWIWKLAAIGVLLGAVAGELKTSWLQSRLLAAVARRSTYTMGPGASPVIRYPKSAPYTDRLGYSRLPSFVAALGRAGFGVTGQARHSAMFQRLMDWGVSAFDGAKPQAGLRLVDRQGDALFAAPYPARAYQRFEDIPPVIVGTLLFIENREVLDADTPYRNPSVEWPRLAGAVVDVGVNLVYPAHKISGGSTLATQIEKMRYSPGGATGSAREKVRQMVSASLRAYRHGEETMEARKRIVGDYLNGLPLAAAAGHGEVHGIGDGLWTWYGADFTAVNQSLSSHALESGSVSAQQALAYRQVLSLLLAVNSPVAYLGKDPRALEARTDTYLRLLTRAGVIPAQLSGGALRVRSVVLRQAPPASAVNFADRKGADAIRAQLVSLLGLEGVYDLDRLDLTVDTTLDAGAQQSAARTLQQFGDPAFAAQSGMLGERLLKPDDTGSVIYSLTLYERSSGANLLRVQTDNYPQPLSVNEGTKLELGSTAKLRTLAHYLEIVASLHQDLSGPGQPPLETGDPLSQWAVEYLASATDKSLPSMLQAAMSRRYSASPAEGFFTGSGLHYFSNFEKEDNGRVLSVSEAFERSVNLVFVRLMRDVVRYHEARLPEAARRETLTRFAEFEGAQFVDRFHQKYRGLPSPELAVALAERRRRRGVHPLELWLLEYLTRHPAATRSEIQEASLQARRDAYDWLYVSRRRAAQDQRIRVILEKDAFAEIHTAWKRLGYPFGHLVPSYATALGSSGDNPAALAELAGIILNDGVRQPGVRIQRLHFAEGTPWDSVLDRKMGSPERVLPPEIAAVLRAAMFNVVENGTARRAFGSVVLSDGTKLPVGGKTGTGDNRIEVTLADRRRIDSKVMNRTATFVFLIGDRFFGVITAFVPGQEAGNYGFTSALPVQAFRTVIHSIQPLLEEASVGPNSPEGRLLTRAALHVSEPRP